MAKAVMMTIITVICQWCHDEIAQKDGHGITGISHGWCANCEKKTEAELQRIHANVLHREELARGGTVANFFAGTILRRKHETE